MTISSIAIKILVYCLTAAIVMCFLGKFLTSILFTTSNLLIETILLLAFGNFLLHPLLMFLDIPKNFLSILCISLTMNIVTFLLMLTCLNELSPANTWGILLGVILLSFVATSLEFTLFSRDRKTI